MPWKSNDAKHSIKKAKSPTAKRQWAKVANKVLKATGNEGYAKRAANAAVKKRRK